MLRLTGQGWVVVSEKGKVLSKPYSSKEQLRRDWTRLKRLSIWMKRKEIKITPDKSGFLGISKRKWTEVEK